MEGQKVFKDSDGMYNWDLYDKELLKYVSEGGTYEGFAKKYGVGIPDKEVQAKFTHLRLRLERANVPIGKPSDSLVLLNKSVRIRGYKEACKK